METNTHMRIWGWVVACLACVCVRERERETRDRETAWWISWSKTNVQIYVAAVWQCALNIHLEITIYVQIAEAAVFNRGNWNIFEKKPTPTFDPSWTHGNVPGCDSNCRWLFGSLVGCNSATTFHSPLWFKHQLISLKCECDIPCLLHTSTLKVSAVCGKVNC